MPSRLFHNLRSSPMFFKEDPPADRYLLRITAGPSYDPSTHVAVPVNQPETVKFSTALADVELSVRINNYRGTAADSPSTSPYFSRRPHAANKDQYSICFRFAPRRPVSEDPGTYDSESANGETLSEKGGSEVSVDDDAGIPGGDLQFGNDFDQPIRDYLPPGFNTALNIVKWWIDPGLEGDAYADAPHLFGPALSSFSTVHCGPGTHDPAVGLLFSEGGNDRGMEMRAGAGMPKEPAERAKWALKKGNAERWTWEYGRSYGFDFFNPYVDFEGYRVQLPGFKMGVLRYWDGQSLRYVLRNKRTKDVYLVVVFTLFLKEDVNADGSLRIPEAEARAKAIGKKPRGEPDEGEGVDSEHEIFKKSGASLDGVK